MVGTRSKEERMAMTGARTPLAIMPKEEQAGVDMLSHDGHPAEGRAAMAGEAQVAQDDQPRGSGERQQRKQHPKYQPKGHGAGPRHQQHKQRRRSRPRGPRPPPLPRTAPPRAAPEQLGAAASTGEMARTEEVQASPERVSQGLGKIQTAAQRKQERLRPRRPPRAAPEQQGASADLGDAAGAEEREEPVLSNPDQRAFKMILRRKMAAALESKGIGKRTKDRLIANLLLMMESMDQPAPELESSVPAVAVGVLRAEEPKDESQWRCKVPTCLQSCHSLVDCPLFLQMPAEERGEIVALSDLCMGCLTPGHGTRAQACPFKDEPHGACAKPKCKGAHHQLLHVEGKQSHCPHQYLGGDAVSKQRYAQIAAARAHAVHQPPVQLTTQRIRAAAGKSCLALWDNGSQMTLTTHKAAKEMGLEPISGSPLNLMGVGGSQKTKSTVQYKIMLFDTGGRAVEVTAYGTDHIMAPLEAVDSTWMRAVFPEVLTGGLEAASGRVDLLIGLDNYKRFPVGHSRVQDAMLQRSRFGTGWIAHGRLPGQGDPATSAEEAARQLARKRRPARKRQLARKKQPARKRQLARKKRPARKRQLARKKQAARKPPWTSRQSRPTGAMSSLRSVAQYVSRTRTRQGSRKSRETGKSWKSTGGWKRIRSGMRGRPGAGLAYACSLGLVTRLWCRGHRIHLRTSRAIS